MTGHFLIVDEQPESGGNVSGVCTCHLWQGSYGTRAGLEGEHEAHRVEESRALPHRVPTVDPAIAAADLILNNPAAAAVYFDAFERDMAAFVVKEIEDATWDLAVDHTNVMAEMEREFPELFPPSREVGQQAAEILRRLGEDGQS